jgi:hypothetical protein
MNGSSTQTTSQANGGTTSTQASAVPASVTDNAASDLICTTGVLPITEKLIREILEASKTLKKSRLQEAVRLCLACYVSATNVLEQSKKRYTGGASVVEVLQTNTQAGNIYTDLFTPLDIEKQLPEHKRSDLVQKAKLVIGSYQNCSGEQSEDWSENMMQLFDSVAINSDACVRPRVSDSQRELDQLVKFWVRVKILQIPDDRTSHQERMHDQQLFRTIDRSRRFVVLGLIELGRMLNRRVYKSSCPEPRQDTSNKYDYCTADDDHNDDHCDPPYDQRNNVPRGCRTPQPHDWNHPVSNHIRYPPVATPAPETSNAVTQAEALMAMVLKMMSKLETPGVQVSTESSSTN